MQIFVFTITEQTLCAAHANVNDVFMLVYAKCFSRLLLPKLRKPAVSMCLVLLHDVCGNSLTHGRCSYRFKSVASEHTLQIKFMNTFWWICLKCILQNSFCEKYWFGKWLVLLTWSISPKGINWSQSFFRHNGKWTYACDLIWYITLERP